MHKRIKTYGSAFLLFGFLLLPLFGVLKPLHAETKLYACQEDEKVGFVVGENMRQANFELTRFILKYDDDKKTLNSEKLGLFGNLPPLQRCDMDITSIVMTCFSDSGSAFAFNTSALSFVRTNVNSSWPNKGAAQIGGNSISYGKCETF